MSSEVNRPPTSGSPSGDSNIDLATTTIFTDERMHFVQIGLVPNDVGIVDPS